MCFHVKAWKGTLIVSEKKDMYQLIIQSMSDNILDPTCLYFVLEQENLARIILIHLDKFDNVKFPRLGKMSKHNSHLC